MATRPAGNELTKRLLILAVSVSVVGLGPVAHAQQGAPSTPSASTPGPGGPEAPAAADNAPNGAQGGSAGDPGAGAGTDSAPSAGPGEGAATSGGANASSPGSGGPNAPTAADTAPTGDQAAGQDRSQTNFLERFLGLQDSPIRIYGWSENGYTYNGLGAIKGKNPNVTVFPNRLADRWQGNQNYLVLEKTLEVKDKVNFGFRFDTLFGNDWQFTKDYGLFDREFTPNHFAGVDFPQIFAEVHLPVLFKDGIDIRGGRFISPSGFENLQAPKRPLYSVANSFNNTPFTLFGVLATSRVGKRLNIYNGLVNGWDRWIDQNYLPNYVGGFNYTSKSGKTTLTSVLITGPDQLPRFAPANSPFLPTGIVTNTSLQRRNNPFYSKSNRTYLSTVLVHDWAGKLTDATEVFFVHEDSVPGIFGVGTIHDSAWYGATHWWIYSFSEKVQGVFRAEIFRDNNGVIFGRADNYYEMTLGMPLKPKPWLWFRPEARYDWAQFSRPYGNGTSKSQLTLAIDAIIQF